MDVLFSDLPTDVAVRLFRKQRHLPWVIWKPEYQRRTIPRWFGAPVGHHDFEFFERMPEYFVKIQSDLVTYLVAYWFFAAIAVAVPFFVFENVVAGLSVLALSLLLNALWFAMWWTRVRQELHKMLRSPLNLADADAISLPNHRELEEAYGDLLKKIIETPAADANRDQILSTLRVVGDAVATLPKSESSQYLEEPERLVRKISELKLNIDQESDAVVRASYERQLDSVEQTLSYTNQQITHKRRLDALKAELRASIQTLILSLNATSTENIDTVNLHTLSESVRAISVEAESFTSAVSELEETLSATGANRAIAHEGEIVMQSLGRR